MPVKTIRIVEAVLKKRGFIDVAIVIRYLFALRRRLRLKKMSDFFLCFQMEIRLTFDQNRLGLFARREQRVLYFTVAVRLSEGTQFYNGILFTHSSKNVDYIHVAC